MSVTIYGIRNCDTMKKARTWLDSHGIGYAFHDYKTSGISGDTLRLWCAALGWETLLNRTGTTFRALPDTDRQDLNEDKAIGLMLSQPSMIKRPVLDSNGRFIAGFKPDVYERLFSSRRTD